MESFVTVYFTSCPPPQAWHNIVTMFKHCCHVQSRFKWTVWHHL